jgi:MFS family permease
MISGLWALAAAGEVPGLTVSGYLADRWGRRPLLMAGLIGQGSIYVLYQFIAPTWGIFPLQMFRSLTYSSYETLACQLLPNLGCANVVVVWLVYTIPLRLGWSSRQRPWVGKSWLAMGTRYLLRVRV